MPPQTYRNFDLVIEEDGDEFQVHVVDSPAGEAHGTFTMPFGTHELENFVLKMGAQQGVRRAGSAAQTVAQAFGRRLYDAVFTSDVEYALRQSLQDCQSQNEGLRVRLRLGKAPSLMDVPWEYLHSTALGRPLALSVDTPVVRYMDMGLPVEPLEVAPPLRILVVASSPTNIPDKLDTARELDNLRDALHDLVQAGRIEVHSLARPTVEDLQHQLRKEAFHILHFMGHGIFDEATGEGKLAFEDETGSARSVAGSDLGMMLHDHRNLQMVVLNACEGARTSVEDPLGGVAQSLARQGIPAVVAMQFAISDVAAKRFSHELYLAIADGYPVDAAVSEARKALYLQNRAMEWGTPVLHLRAADGRVFDMVAAPAPSEVPELLDVADAQARGDDLGTISAIGILQRILALDPGNAVAAAQLASLQQSARRDEQVSGDATTATTAATTTTASPGSGPPASDSTPSSDPAPAATDAEEPPAGQAETQVLEPSDTNVIPPAATETLPPQPAATRSQPAATPVAQGPDTDVVPVADVRDRTRPVPPPLPRNDRARQPSRTSPPSQPSPGSPAAQPGHGTPASPPPRPPDTDGGSSPWPRRIAIAAGVTLVAFTGLGILGGFLEEGDGPVDPTTAPTFAPTVAPTVGPTVAPTVGPTTAITAFPTEVPSITNDLAWYGDVAPGTSVALGPPFTPFIDGVLDEWPTDGFFIGIEEVVHGAGEVSGVGMVLWDAEALYVSATVTDGFVQQAWQFDPAQLWRGDSVSFEWSRAPSDDPAATVAEGELHVMLGPYDGVNELVPAVNPGRGGAFRAGGVEPGIILSSALTPFGYDVEAAIPWDLLGGTPARGEVVGFNLNISNGTGDGNLSSMTSSTPGRTSPNQPRPACWGRMLLWDDPYVPPESGQLPRLSDAAPC